MALSSMGQDRLDSSFEEKALSRSALTRSATVLGGSPSIMSQIVE